VATTTPTSVEQNPGVTAWPRRLFAILPTKIQSLGIAPRLLIACGSVLVLVLMTTYLARQSSRRAAQQVALIESQHEPLARVAQQMLDAAAVFNQSTLELANPEAAPNLRRIDQDLERLTRLGSAYELLAPSSTLLMEQYRGQVAQHELRARELLLLAGRRRVLVKQYWKLFDTLDSKVHAIETQLREVDHAGSAVLLIQALGRIQDRFGSYASAGGKELERAVADGEAGFRVALDANRAAMSQHVSSADVASLNSQFEGMIRARRSLVATNNLIAAASGRFFATSAQLNSFIETSISDPARRELALAAIGANEVANDVDRTLSKLGIMTLAILLVICIATAYGVIIPVRKLIAAIGSIASGNRGRRVEQGGIHELDTLAAAFNEMAVQLETAEKLVQRYQADLEQRVDERTQQLQFLSQHDPLTRLPNRRQLFTHLEAELQRAGTAGTRIVLLVLDLDNFKTVNDTLGHHVGDLLLQSVAERLTAFMVERRFVARLGGDEFTVVCEIDDSVDAVDSLAARAVEQFQRAVPIEDRNLAIGVSIGAAVFPEHAQDATSLLRAADAALFHAKETGRNCYSVYGPRLLEAASKHFMIEQDLRRALEEREFELFYQPQLNMDTLTIGSVEALIRWRRADGTMVMPGQFLAVAERSGLIKEISDWVLDAAIQQAARWRAEGWSDVIVAVNLSAQQLFDPAFAVRLEAVLRKHALPPQALEIELTESALQTGPATIEALHWLRSFGVAIALDDFGTGYSSLTSIEQLPLTRVKIDRSLIMDIDRSPRYAAIVRSVIGLCRSLGLAVTAEGIERRSQFAFLYAQGSVDIQGYFIARPMPAEAMGEFRTQGMRRLQELAAEMPRFDSQATLSDSMVARQFNMIVNQ
jgi:diguanylate cyclase (GGDEF)-like protein